jgi:hypothetical protein
MLAHALDSLILKRILTSPITATSTNHTTTSQNPPKKPHTMLFAARIVRQARPAVAFRSAAAPSYTIRPFSQAQQLRLKEDANRSPEELERIKQEQLKQQKEGKGQWNEELASSSESHVAADKQKVDDHQQHMSDLQKETAQQSEESHPSAKK